MKKIVLATCMLLSAIAGMAQGNLQLHYDFGRNVYPDEQAERPKVTGTFEQFSADGLGTWFYFIDMDFYNDGAAGAYVELSREFNIGKKGFAAHIEYDGGLCSKKSFSARYQQAALLGAVYNMHSADYKKTLSLQVMYKQFFKGTYNHAFPSCQFTGVWSTTFAHDALTFAGVFDFWRDEQANGMANLCSSLSHSCGLTSTQSRDSRSAQSLSVPKWSSTAASILTTQRCTGIRQSL